MIQLHLKRALAVLAAATIIAGTPASSLADGLKSPADKFSTTTPIKHVVVIFQENVSFDHYFATYPSSVNPSGQPKFSAVSETPRVNNLLTSSLLDENPNSTQPFRLDRTQEVTCDQDYDYA